MTVKETKETLANRAEMLTGTLEQVIGEMPTPRKLDIDVVKMLIGIAGHVMAVQDEATQWRNGLKHERVEDVLHRMIREAYPDHPLVFFGSAQDEAKLIARQIVAMHAEGKLKLE